MPVNDRSLNRGVRFIGLGGISPPDLVALFRAVPNFADIAIEVDEETWGALQSYVAYAPDLRDAIVLSRSPVGEVARVRHNPVFLVKPVSTFMR